MSAFRRLAVAAALGGAIGPAWLILIYGAAGTLYTDFAETPPRLVSGIYPAEREPASGLTFAWTSGLLTIRLPDLDRRLPWELSLRARAARADPAENPDLTVHVDGVALLTLPASSDFSDVRVTIPPRPERRGVTVAVESSRTVVPGPHDPRPLGVMLDRFEVSPAGIPLPPRDTLRHLALSTALAACALAAIGSSSASIVAVVLTLGAMLAFAAARGFAPYTTYPASLTAAGAPTWLAVVLVQLVRRVQGRPLQRAGRFVLALSALAVIVKLAVLLHPHMPVGDAMFQAHRFHEVLAGRLYFTSLAPGNYAFPYAPGLYVLALPFADLVQRGPADMTLLRTIVVVADAAAAGLLYVAYVRAGGPTITGALAVVMYHLVPLDFRVITVGNLTNAFAQSVAAIALALLIAPFGARLAWAALLGLAFGVSFLSHTSTFAIGVACGALVAGLFVWRAPAELRRTGLAAGGAVTAAFAAAVLLYYAHFGETYRSEWARISAETAAAAPDAGGRGIAARLTSVPRYIHLYWGLPMTALALWGFGLLRAQPPTVRLTVCGWTLGCVFFLIVGILTPVDMRHYLAIIPALSLAAAIAASAAWEAGGVRRAAAAALVIWAAWIFVDVWWSTLV